MKKRRSVAHEKQYSQGEKKKREKKKVTIDKLISTVLQKARWDLECTC